MTGLPRPAAGSHTGQIPRLAGRLQRRHNEWLLQGDGRGSEAAVPVVASRNAALSDSPAGLDVDRAAARPAAGAKFEVARFEVQAPVIARLALFFSQRRAGGYAYRPGGGAGSGFDKAGRALFCRRICRYIICGRGGPATVAPVRSGRRSAREGDALQHEVAVAHDEQHVLERRDVVQRVAGNQDQVGFEAGGDAAGTIADA